MVASLFLIAVLCVFDRPRFDSQHLAFQADDAAEGQLRWLLLTEMIEDFFFFTFLGPKSRVASWYCWC